MDEKTFSKFNGYVVKDAQARSDIKTINNEIATINTNINNNKTNIETNKNNIENNTKSITTLNNNLGVTNQTVSSLETSVLNITQDNQNINTKMDEINAAFEGMGDIANNTEEINAKIDSNTDLINANTTKITELEEGLNSIEYVDNLTSTDTTKGLTANQGKVLNEKIDSEIASAKEELKAYNKSIISCTLAEPLTLECTGWSEHKIPMTSVISKVGEGLTLESDGSILVGEGIDYIKISSTYELTCQTTNASGYVMCFTEINDTNKIVTRNVNMSSSTEETVSTTPCLFAVQPGDKISLSIEPSYTTNILITGTTYFICTIEEV